MEDLVGKKIRKRLRSKKSWFVLLKKGMEMNLCPDVFSMKITLSLTFLLLAGGCRSSSSFDSCKRRRRDSSIMDGSCFAITAEKLMKYPEGYLIHIVPAFNFCIKSDSLFLLENNHDDFVVTFSWFSMPGRELWGFLGIRNLMRYILIPLPLCGLISDSVCSTNR